MMKSFLYSFVLLVTPLYGQGSYTLDTLNISNKVSVHVKYRKIVRSYFVNDFVNVRAAEGTHISEYVFPVKFLRYYGLETEVIIHPSYNRRTRNLAESIKLHSTALHDSIIYTYLQEELKPNHFSSGGCMSYKISPLKKWQGKYPYVDTEEVYVKLQAGEKTYHTHSYRLLWVDSCQYEFSMHTVAYKKRKLSKSRRCVRRNFRRLVETVYVREEDELIELKPPE